MRTKAPPARHECTRAGNLPPNLVCRERNDGLYRVITYLCAKMLDELTIAVAASLAFSCIVFYGVRFQGSLVLFWLVYLTTLAIGIGAANAPFPCPLLPATEQDADYSHKVS